LEPGFRKEKRKKEKKFTPQLVPELVCLRCIKFSSLQDLANVSTKKRKKKRVAPSSTEANSGDGEQEDIAEDGNEPDTPQNSPLLPMLVSPSSLMSIFKEPNSPPAENSALSTSLDGSPVKDMLAKELKDDEKEGKEDDKKEGRVSGNRRKRGMSER
jgi:hypothetical protein